VGGEAVLLLFLLFFLVVYDSIIAVLLLLLVCAAALLCCWPAVFSFWGVFCSGFSLPAWSGWVFFCFFGSAGSAPLCISFLAASFCASCTIST